MKALKEREHKVIYKDGDKVVKVFDETFSKADVLNEALNMARVEETGLRIPKLLNVSKVDGKWAITREYIEGTPLSQLMAQHPEKQDEYLNTFVDIQLEILGKTCPHLNKIKDKMHAKISASDYEATPAKPMEADTGSRTILTKGRASSPAEAVPHTITKVREAMNTLYQEGKNYLWK